MCLRYKNKCVRYIQKVYVSESKEKDENVKMSTNPQSSPVYLRNSPSSRPVSDSPTVFSLARRQISLTFLAERAEREK